MRSPAYEGYEWTRILQQGAFPMTSTSSRPRAAQPNVVDRFLRALTARDFVGLAACFSHDLRFRALIPRGLREATGADDSARYFQGWFGPADRIDVVETRTQPLGDRQHLAWRLLVHDADGRRVVEQQAYATLRDGVISELDLVCSGLRPEHPSA